ncbi:uncharacterized protein LOC126834506 [Adelges cooleyi]|uniref:uncharacterized protein LOC126834506 n=1 Tax=Adelges cooleyi TaxID=133065 RepID=UPI00217F95F0|nr:uncharacterized protein LOC126834506 [Adelges cooleyi]
MSPSNVFKTEEHENPAKWQVTFEPMLFSYLVSSILTILTNQNLFIQKACRVDLQTDADKCAELDYRGGRSDSEIDAQLLVTYMLIWQTVLQNVTTSILAVFLGSWSDRYHRRKFVLLLPIVGELVRNLCLMVCVYFFDELPLSVAGLAQTLPVALTGGWIVLFMAVFSYIGDTSEGKMRAIRVGIVNGTVILCFPLGTALSGILYANFGFYGVYGISSALFLFSIAWTGLYIHEDNFNVLLDRRPWSVSIADFFDVKHFRKAVQTTFWNEDSTRRFSLIALSSVIIIIKGPMIGERSIMYLYTRYKFNWNEVDYSIFSTYSMIVNLVGTGLAVYLLINKLGIDECLVGAIALVGKIFSEILYAFAKNDFEFYVAPLANLIYNTAIVAMKSTVTRIVPSEELGQVSAVTSIGENLVPIAYNPLYSLVYVMSLNVFSGTIFLLGAVLTAPGIFIYLWLYKHNCNTYESIGEHKKNELKKEYGSMN